MATRPSKHFTFLVMAHHLSKQSTCSRRQVGAIFVNDRSHIVASGYNGAPYGFGHCIDNPCNGALLSSGTGLAECGAVHAEQNALMQCSDVHSIYSAYLTCSPCMHCLKMLLNTGCRNIYFLEEYADSEKCKQMWENAGRLWHNSSNIVYK
jgi:dCMP deaminase